MRALLARLAATEPARLAELNRSVLVALIGAGWLTIPSPTINTVASAVAFAGSWLLTRFVRSRVAPVSKSKGD